jgi:hypothetical protein
MNSQSDNGQSGVFSQVRVYRLLRFLGQIGLDRTGLPYPVSYDLVQPEDDRGPDQTGREKHDRGANNQRYEPFDVSHSYTFLRPSEILRRFPFVLPRASAHSSQ